MLLNVFPLALYVLPVFPDKMQDLLESQQATGLICVSDSVTVTHSLTADIVCIQLPSFSSFMSRCFQMHFLTASIEHSWTMEYFICLIWRLWEGAGFIFSVVLQICDMKSISCLY